MTKMTKTPFLIPFHFFILSITGAGAFSPVQQNGRYGLSPKSSILFSEQRLLKGQSQRSDFLAFLGTVVTGSILSQAAEPAHATIPMEPSSSMYLSDDIKTFDLSMPSYDSINTLKADEKALGIEDAPEPKNRATRSSKSKTDSGGSGNSMLSSVLPSMNKSGPSKKPKPTKKAPAEKATKPSMSTPSKDEFETMDLSLPSYSDSTATKGKDFFAI